MAAKFKWLLFQRLKKYTSTSYGKNSEKFEIVAVSKILFPINGYPLQAVSLREDSTKSLGDVIDDAPMTSVKKLRFLDRRGSGKQSYTSTPSTSIWHFLRRKYATSIVLIFTIRPPHYTSATIQETFFFKSRNLFSKYWIGALPVIAYFVT